VPIICWSGVALRDATNRVSVIYRSGVAEPGSNLGCGRNFDLAISGVDVATAYISMNSGEVTVDNDNIRAMANEQY
jgi:hypothetical protein